jgi:hypothetical protein
MGMGRRPTSRAEIGDDHHWMGQLLQTAIARARCTAWLANAIDAFIDSGKSGPPSRSPAATLSTCQTT